MQMYQKFRRIGGWIGTHIKRQYPFPNSTSAAIAFVNFIPRHHHDVYEKFQRDCMAIFLRAYICSILERHPNKALRGMGPVIQKSSIFQFLISLRNDELPIKFSDRDALEEIIVLATREFENALEVVAEKREDAKMILISIMLMRGNKESVRPIQIQH